MSLSLTLLLSTCVLLPQQDPGAAQPVLTKSDHEALRNKLRDYYSARDLVASLRDQTVPENRRAAAIKKETQAKEKFEKDWEGRCGKKDALASMPDLRAAFANCFEFDRQTGSGEVFGVKPKNKDLAPYDQVLPKKYRADSPMPTVLMMRGHEGDKGWTSAREWYERTWKAAPEAAEYVFIMPELNESVDFDPVVDLATDAGRDTDDKRGKVVLGALGAASLELNLDRDRFYYDCGRGSCRYALQLATYSPHRFAGIVLRAPVEPGDLRLDSLAGVPILLLRTEATKDVCGRLADALNKLQAGTATVLDAKGDYPHGESAGDIAAWMATKSRDMFRSHVVVANTHDKYRRAFWVVMGQAEPLASVKPEDRPRLEITADRATNRLTVTARNVLDFGLLLNDAILDLDKEITAVINGKAQPPFKLERSLKQLVKYVGDFRDPGMVFVAEKGFEVPVEEKPTAPVEPPKDKDSKDGPPAAK